MARGGVGCVEAFATACRFIGGCRSVEGKDGIMGNRVIVGVFMIDHISTYATDCVATKVFYEAVFVPLGYMV